MITLELQDLYVVLSVAVPYLILSVLSYRIFANLFQNNKKIVYIFTGATLSFYIAFVYPFMFINIYAGILIFWSLVIILSVYSIIGIVKKNKKKLDLLDLINLILVILSIILVIFWVSFNNISPNFTDAYSNYKFIKKNLGSENIEYFPGLSIIAAIPSTIIDPFYSLNFFGASLAIVFTLFINLTLKSILSLRGLLIFNLVLHSTFYYPLLYTRIGLNNSQIFSVIFVSIIVILIFDWENSKKYKFVIFPIVIFSALVTAPHILFITIPGIIVAGLITYKSYVLAIAGNIALLLAIIFSMMLSAPDLIYISKNLGPDRGSTQDQILFLLNEILRIKYPIRSPLESIFSLSSYLILILAIMAAIIYRQKKLKTIEFMSIVTFIYGISLNTGIGEFAIMKGRIGWYFMYSAAILVSLILDDLYRKGVQFKKILSVNKLITLVISMNILFVLVNPPNAYRYADENSLIEFDNMLKLDGRTKILVYSDIENIKFTSDKVMVSTEGIIKKNLFDYVVLNMNSTIPDPILANMRDYEDKDIELFKDEQNKIIKKRLANNRNLIDLFLNSGFSVASKKQNYIILENINK